MAQDHREHLLAYPDEIGMGFDRASIAGLEEASAKVQLVSMRNASRPRRHHDQVCCEKQRLLDAMGDEKAHLAGAMPDVENELLDRFAGEGVQRAERLVHEHQL